MKKQTIIILILIVMLGVWILVENKKAIEKCKSTGKTEYECNIALTR